jgi:hypothetical protein
VTDYSNPRSLEGELIVVDDRESKEDAIYALEQMEPLRLFTTEPGWEHLENYLAVAEREATETLLVAGPDRMTSYQARIAVLRELRALPGTLAERAARLNAVLSDEGEDE